MISYADLDVIWQDWQRQRERGVSVDQLWRDLEARHQRHPHYGSLCFALEVWAGPPSWKQR